MSNIFAMFKRWLNILTNKNVVAIRQDVGKKYSIENISGYYNDLTGKVNDKVLYDNDKIPLNEIAGNKKVYFPITIFQFALGLWDLSLLGRGDYDWFIKICNYIIGIQEENGSWDCFSPIKYHHYTVSSMGQGEAISCLIRAYTYTGNTDYLNSSRKAVQFMCTEIKDGGTLFKLGDDVIFEEYPNFRGKSSTVLNGWIFSLFGIFDYLKVENDPNIKNIFDQSVDTLYRYITKYDNGYWSLYDLEKRIASPAYHSLHIALLKVLNEIKTDQNIEVIIQKWDNYQSRRFNRFRAITRKIVQKLFSKKAGVIIR